MTFCSYFRIESKKIAINERCDDEKAYIRIRCNVSQGNFFLRLKQIKKKTFIAFYYNDINGWLESVIYSKSFVLGFTVANLSIFWYWWRMIDYWKNVDIGSQAHWALKSSLRCFSEQFWFGSGTNIYLDFNYRNIPIPIHVFSCKIWLLYGSAMISVWCSASSPIICCSYTQNAYIYLLYIWAYWKTTCSGYLSMCFDAWKGMFTECWYDVHTLWTGSVYLVREREQAVREPMTSSMTYHVPFANEKKWNKTFCRFRVRERFANGSRSQKNW